MYMHRDMSSPLVCLLTLLYVALVDRTLHVLSQTQVINLGGKGMWQKTVHAVYDAQETRQRNCRTCGRRLRLGNDRPCPHPDVVQAYLHQNTDFTGDIAKSDRVCLTCYKSHSALTKTNCTSRDDDLRPLVESVRGCASMGHDIINTAILLDVGEMLLENHATLLPTVCASFHHYATELAVEHGIEEPPELKLVNTRWILCEITKYQHHVACVCKVRKYGTLVYRPTSDIHALALWKIKKTRW